jgi:glycerol 2-dehydrogenase (NADP+)
MNPALSKFILAHTPDHILHPTPTMNTPLPLNTGASIPALGLGTWQSEPGQVKAAVIHAIKSGYRHIDCAFCYQNEDEVGEALKEVLAKKIVKREELFITTKLWCTFHTRVEEGLDASLKALGLDYVDLFLVHWPIPMNPKGECLSTLRAQLKVYLTFVSGNHPIVPKLADGSRDLDHSITHVDTWKSMEKLPETGKVKAIGVANYSVKYLNELLPHTKITPAVNQIENHPYLPQQEIVDYCKGKGILITAYSPFGSTGSPMMKEEGVLEVAKKHSVDAGTVLLSYHGKLTLNYTISKPLLTHESCTRLLRPCEISNTRSHRIQPQTDLPR